MRVRVLLCNVRIDEYMPSRGFNNNFKYVMMAGQWKHQLPLWYFRFPNFDSSICTRTPGPPIGEDLFIMISSHSSLQKLSQSTAVRQEISICLMISFCWIPKNNYRMINRRSIIYPNFSPKSWVFFLFIFFICILIIWIYIHLVIIHIANILNDLVEQRQILIWHVSTKLFWEKKIKKISELQLIKNKPSQLNFCVLITRIPVVLNTGFYSMTENWKQVKRHAFLCSI